jgi:hypothetical protein
MATRVAQKYKMKSLLLFLAKVTQAKLFDRYMRKAELASECATMLRYKQIADLV